MEYYSGDTFLFNYYCLDKDENKIDLTNKEIFIILYNTFNLNMNVSKTIIGRGYEQSVIFKPEEMKNVKYGHYKLEVKLIEDENIITTTYQDVNVIESWCYRE